MKRHIKRLGVGLIALACVFGAAYLIYAAGRIINAFMTVLSQAPQRLHVSPDVIFGGIIVLFLLAWAYALGYLIVKENNL